MGKKERKRKSHRRIFGLLVVLMALSAIMIPEGSAETALDQNQSQTQPASKPVQVAVLPRKMPELPVSTSPKTASQTSISEKETQAQAPQEEKPAVVVVPESEPVEDTYFSDVVFVGDSRTEGFSLYSGLKEGQYLFSVGATVESVFSKATEKTARGKVSILDALADLECSKVYLMLGANELGWVRPEMFQTQYGKVIDRIREDHPDVQVVIQSILPVSAKQDAKGSYVNNQRIRTYNQLLEELAEEKNCPYINVAEAVSDENGCLRAEWNFDGVHLNTAGCKAWLEYLRTHPVMS